MAVLEPVLIYKANPDLPTVLPGFPGVPFVPRPPGQTQTGRFCGEMDSLHRHRLPLGRVLRWQLGMLAKGRAAQKAAAGCPPPLQNVAEPLPETGNCLVWLGHAGFLLLLNNRRILIDPCCTAPPLTRRYLPPPEISNNLGRIDYLLISHGHLDHLSLPDLRRITLDSGSIGLLPLGMGDLVRRACPELLIQEAGWWQQYQTPGLSLDGLEIFFLPARHWSRRALRDRNTVLWGGYLLRHAGKTVYFAGDTAYGPHFRQIRAQFGPPDYCLLPIGAYSPDWLMRRSHLGPEQALTAFRELAGRYLLPMHWGMYHLSSEPWGEPPARLGRAAAAQGLAFHHLVLPQPGQVVPLP